MKRSNTQGHRTGLEIAIIGMSGRFPGASNVDQFWQNLCAGVESITRFSDVELKASGVESALIANPRYIKAKAILDDIESFDAEFFGIQPGDALIMDPQQRLFLECAWEALENAGYDPEKYNGAIGVYAGAGMNTYIFNLHLNDSYTLPSERYRVFISNDKDFLPTRVSYKLNLTGSEHQRSNRLLHIIGSSAPRVPSSHQRRLRYRIGGRRVRVRSAKNWLSLPGRNDFLTRWTLSCL